MANRPGNPTHFGNIAHAIRNTILPNMGPEEIDVALDNFELLHRRQVLNKYHRENCSICGNNEFRREINRMLLEGAAYREIAKKFTVQTQVLSRHFQIHLSLVLQPQAQDALVNLATKITADTPYPINRSKIRQLRWIQSQLMVARQIVYDNMDKPYAVNFEAVEIFVDIVKSMRETIVIAFNKEDDYRDRPQKLIDDGKTLDISPEAKRVIEYARKQRMKKTMREVKENVGIYRKDKGLPRPNGKVAYPELGAPANRQGEGDGENQQELASNDRRADQESPAGGAGFTGPPESAS